MDFEILKEGMKEIVEISESVPKTFRKRCFEMLLSQLLAESSNTYSALPSVPVPEEVIISPSPILPDGKSASELPPNAQLNVFMRKRKVTLEQLSVLLYLEQDESGKNIVHFIHEPDHTTPVATAQIQWALLLALKSNIEKGEISLLIQNKYEQSAKRVDITMRATSQVILRARRHIFEMCQSQMDPLNHFQMLVKKP